jgi:hypothetical protein
MIGGAGNSTGLSRLSKAVSKRAGMNPAEQIRSICLFLIKVLHKSLSFGHDMSYEAAIDAGAFGACGQMKDLRVPFLPRIGAMMR